MESKRADWPVPVNAFIAGEPEIQRDQFLRVNNTSRFRRGSSPSCYLRSIPRFRATWVISSLGSGLQWFTGTGQSARFRLHQRGCGAADRPRSDRVLPARRSETGSRRPRPRHLLPMSAGIRPAKHYGSGFEREDDANSEGGPHRRFRYSIMSFI